MDSFDKFRAPLESALARFEQTLQRQVGEFSSAVKPVVKDVLAHTGKHLRPMFLFASAGVERACEDRVQRMAAVVELIHLATLVHDDILDSAQTRHGALAHYKIYDSQVSVLTGDALFLLAYELASKEDDLWVAREVAKAARLTCVGEIEQGLYEKFHGGKVLSEAEYIEQIRGKTGRLFGLSCALGAHLRGASEEEVGAYREFGESFGIAYQIYDDAVDVWGDEKVFKKTLGTDQAQHKWTLPWIKLAEKIGAKKIEGLWENRDAALKAMEEQKIKTVVRSVFEAYLQKSQQGLDNKDLSRAASYLENTWEKSLGIKNNKA